MNAGRPARILWQDQVHFNPVWQRLKGDAGSGIGLRLPRLVCEPKSREAKGREYPLQFATIHSR
jgi:hypothetical protein